MAPASALQLLDLPPDLLARIGAQLPFNERLQLSLVCRRWRDVCAGPSQLWGSIDARICRGVSKHTGGLFQPCVDEFARCGRAGCAALLGWGFGASRRLTQAAVVASTLPPSPPAPPTCVQVVCQARTRGGAAAAED